jgi:hypothetical protein
MPDIKFKLEPATSVDDLRYTDFPIFTTKNKKLYKVEKSAIFPKKTETEEETDSSTGTSGVFEQVHYISDRGITPSNYTILKPEKPVNPAEPVNPHDLQTLNNITEIDETNPELKTIYLFRNKIKIKDTPNNYSYNPESKFYTIINARGGKRKSKRRSSKRRKSKRKYVK